MTEENRDDKYIKCARCKCKFLNGEDNITKDFGYNRLNERFKTCVKCRASMKEKHTCDKCGFDISRLNMKRHQRTNICNQWQLIISRIDITDPDIIEFNYTMNDEPIPIYKDHNRTIEYKTKYLGYDPNAKPLSVEEQIAMIQWNECLISSDDDEEVKEKKYVVYGTNWYHTDVLI